MIREDFRRRVLARERLVGTIVTLPAPAAAETMALAGFDWLFIDTEHGPFGAGVVQSLIQAVGGRCACVVRVPDAAEVWIKKVLDVGADGVIVPKVNSVEQAEQVVRWCRYPPAGERGVGVARAHGYGLRFSQYMETANERVAVIVQVEHKAGVDAIEGIVSVAGVDAVFIGPYDLSASLGRPGAVDHPDVAAAIERVLRACLDAGRAIGIFGIDARALMPHLGSGYSLLAVGTDTIFMGAAASAAVDALHG